MRARGSWWRDAPPSCNERVGYLPPHQKGVVEADPRLKAAAWAAQEAQEEAQEVGSSCSGLAVGLRLREGGEGERERLCARALKEAGGRALRSVLALHPLCALLGSLLTTGRRLRRMSGSSRS